MILPNRASQYSNCSILEQLQFLSYLQGQTHVESVTAIKLGCEQGMDNCGEILLIIKEEDTAGDLVKAGNKLSNH